MKIDGSLGVPAFLIPELRGFKVENRGIFGATSF